jgi:hypothetical protein
MAAAIRDRRVSAEVRAEYGSDWIQSVREVWRPGDILVCYEGEMVGIRQRPLDQVLRSTFDTPIYILPTVSDAQPARSGAISRALSWVGSIGVLVVFFLLQVRIVQWLHDWGQTALLSLSILAEIMIIWIWDSLTA